jgi:hypothetical protein
MYLRPKFVGFGLGLLRHEVAAKIFNALGLNTIESLCTAGTGLWALFCSRVDLGKAVRIVSSWYKLRPNCTQFIFLPLIYMFLLLLVGNKELECLEPLNKLQFNPLGNLQLF